VRMRQAEAGVVSLGFLLSALGVDRVVPVCTVNIVEYTYQQRNPCPKAHEVFDSGRRGP